jgi:hypothetical protein
MYIDGAPLHIYIGTPNAIEQFFAREHGFGPLHEMLQQPKFCWSKVDIATTTAYAVFVHIQYDIGKARWPLA